MSNPAETTTPQAAVEIVDERALAVVAEENSIDAPAAQGLLSSFAPFAKKARELVQQSDGVTDPKLARAFRLKLREVRIGVEDTRKKLKEDYLRTGKAIDGMANVLKFVIEPQEDILLGHERAAEIAEANRKRALAEERRSLLVPLGFNPEFTNLAEMPAEAFDNLLVSAKAAYEAKLEQARKAEADRLAREKAEAEERAAREKAAAEERERLRLENERLRKEFAERERLRLEEQAKAEAAAKEAAAKAKAEREAAEAAIRKEREARERLEREAALKAKAEAEHKAAEEKARKKAARAPDKTKVIELGKSLGSVPMPEVASLEAAAIIAEVRRRLRELVEWVEQQGGEL